MVSFDKRHNTGFKSSIQSLDWIDLRVVRWSVGVMDSYFIQIFVDYLVFKFGSVVGKEDLGCAIS